MKRTKRYEKIKAMARLRLQLKNPASGMHGIGIVTNLKMTVNATGQTIRFKGPGVMFMGSPKP